MAKPKIIIADKDINYIIPLQLKFAVDFFEKVELEIITDENYFKTYFLTPKKADILIVSNELYTHDIQRHNISHIFVMNERSDVEQVQDLGVDYIFKYTSIKEVFNEIISKASDVLATVSSVKKKTQIILVYSPCNDIIKTAVAMGVCTCLTKNYKNILYINAGHLQVFQRMLDNQLPIISNDVYTKLAKATDNIYNEIKHVIRKEYFKYLPPFKAALMSFGLKYSLYEKIIVSAQNAAEYDYIVVDADATFDEDKTQLFSIADKVIIVTEQTEPAIYATNALVDNVTGVNEDKYVFVCNGLTKDDGTVGLRNVDMRFNVSDYIEHNVCYEQIKCADLINYEEIQKIAFLAM